MGNEYQSRRNDTNESEISQKDLEKQNSRQVVKGAAKEAGNKYLEANGVPAPVAKMATNKLEKNPFVNKAINRVADNKQVSNLANKLKPGMDAAGLTNQNNGSENPGEDNKSGISQLKGLIPGSASGSKTKGETGGVADIADLVMKIKKIPPWAWPIIGYALLFMFAIIVVIATLQPLLDFLGITTSLGASNSYGFEYKVDENSEQGQFYKRVVNAYNINKGEPKKIAINAGIIASTYTIANRYNSSFKYADMDEALINTLIDNMISTTNSIECTLTEGDQTSIKYLAYNFGDPEPNCPDGYVKGAKVNKYSLDMKKYDEYLKSTFMPEKIKSDLTEIEKTKILEEIYQIEKTYQEVFFKKGVNGKIDAGYIPSVAYGQFGSPLNKMYMITSGYQETNRCLSDGICRPHLAIDLDTIDGSENYDILASSDGIVSYVVTNSVGCGNEVRLRHNIDGKIYETRYCHLSSMTVSIADPSNPPTVYKGQKIGVAGCTGRSFGSNGSCGVHLHFEIREGIYGQEGQRVVNPTFVVKDDSNCINCK